MDDGELPWSEQEIRGIRARLLEFFEARRRPLPWRDGPDPYGILVSEVMSQQTRVETVVPYYRRWMERFPNAATLAAADEEEVLSLWEGLGYYSRARNLHRAAREIEARYGGRVPADPDELRSLPGVGPYTAGAVASIAHGVAAPAVDGNVRRVLARLMDDARPSPGRLARWAGALVDPERPGELNQALMELGSLVCTPRSPACARCPVAGVCGARAAGTAEERPAPKARGRVPHRDEGVLVLVRGWRNGAGEMLLRRRPREGLLAGMWEFPGAVAEAPAARGGAEAAAGEVLEALAAREGRGRLEPLPVVRHAFSHLRVSYHPFLCVSESDRAATSRNAARDASPARWITRAEALELPVPVAQRAILRAAEMRLERSETGA